MNKYRDYDAYALSSDASFRTWVLHASAEEAAFWDEWLRQNPDRTATVEQARAFVVAVQRQYGSPILNEEVQTGVDRIMAQIQAESASEPAVVPLKSRWNVWLRPVAAAAMLMLTLGLGWRLLHTRQNRQATVAPSSVGQHSLWADRVNTGQAPLTLLLEDGSVVTLEPGSRLQYPRRFSGPQRGVTLTGEAFFEVAHRPQQPFVVTTADFMTTVLGTSFRIRSSSPEHKAFVVVRSGKVAVQTRVLAGSSATETAVKSPVILERNQQVVAEKESQQPLQRTVVQQVTLTHNNVNREQIFSDVAVSTVFDALENQYGVSIQYDRAVLSRCVINTSFVEENLRERLSAVCQAINATYQIANDKIVVSSSGCTL